MEPQFVEVGELKLVGLRYDLAYPYDLEYYGDAFQGDQQGSVVDIYLPVKKK